MYIIMYHDVFSCMYHWLLKIIGLFCKRALLKRRYSAKETYNLKELANCSMYVSPPLWGMCLFGSLNTHLCPSTHMCVHRHDILRTRRDTDVNKRTFYVCMEGLYVTCVLVSIEGLYLTCVCVRVY